MFVKFRRSPIKTVILNDNVVFIFFSLVRGGWTGIVIMISHQADPGVKFLKNEHWGNSFVCVDVLKHIFTIEVQ